MEFFISTLLFGIVIAFIHPINWSGTLIAAAAINGIPWSIAQILQIKSFDYLGVARAMPLSSGLQLALTAAVGAFAFNEWPQTWQLVLGFGAIGRLLAKLMLGLGVTVTEL